MNSIKNACDEIFFDKIDNTDNNSFNTDEVISDIEEEYEWSE